MRCVVAAIAVLVVDLGVLCPAARAQEPPPRIGRYVVDLHSTVLKFPSSAALAQSRDLTQAELPGVGMGLDIGAHLYLLKWRAITFGIGGELLTARAHQTPASVEGQTTPALSPVTERFTSLSPQLSFNFGTRSGWSYISGGFGRSSWSIVPEGESKIAADEEKLTTYNYGGGARWFAKSHLAFSLDVRFWAMNPGTPQLRLPATPRSRLLVFGAGVSIR